MNYDQIKKELEPMMNEPIKGFIIVKGTDTKFDSEVHGDGVVLGCALSALAGKDNYVAAMFITAMREMKEFMSLDDMAEIYHKVEVLEKLEPETEEMSMKYLMECLERGEVKKPKRAMVVLVFEEGNRCLFYPQISTKEEDKAEVMSDEDWQQVKAEVIMLGSMLGNAALDDETTAYAVIAANRAYKEQFKEEDYEQMVATLLPEYEETSSLQDNETSSSQGEEGGGE